MAGIYGVDDADELPRSTGGIYPGHGADIVGAGAIGNDHSNDVGKVIRYKSVRALPKFTAEVLW